jgi:cytochrome c biogenesis protein CcdA
MSYFMFGDRLKHVAVGIILLFLLSALPALAEKPKGGRLVVEGSYRISLGEFPAESVQTVAYKLKNVGDAAIGIQSVSRACGCADAFITTNRVDAGAAVCITFKTYPDKLPGTFTKTFYVITDSADSRTKLVQLVVTGNGIVTKWKVATNEVAAAVNALTNSFKSLEPQNPQKTQNEMFLSRFDRMSVSSMLYTNSFHSFNSLIKNTPYGALEANFKSLDIEFFVQEGCAECLILRRDYLPTLANRYTGHIRTVVSDTHSLATFMRLLERLEASGIKANEPVYMVVDGKQVLSGWGEISKRGFGMIDAALSVTSTGSISNSAPPLVRRSHRVGGCLCEKLDSGNASRTEENPAARLFRRFCWPAVAVAGLADGLNPCAFATIVFLTSLLASGGRRGRSVFIGGLAFCVASFVTYFLIGFGLLAALRRLEGLLTVRALVEWGTMAALMILGAFSLLDAWRYSQSGDAGSVRLQLPAGVKRRIRLFARERWGGAAVFGTGLLCGAGVTLLESVCTGQMYLPTLVFMSRDGGGFRAWGMLLLYNILFIVPLFAVFLLGAFGVRSQRLAELTRRHVVPSKILLSLVFFALAAFLLLYALKKG